MDVVKSNRLTERNKIAAIADPIDQEEITPSVELKTRKVEMASNLMLISAAAVAPMKLKKQDQVGCCESEEEEVYIEEYSDSDCGAENKQSSALGNVDGRHSKAWGGALETSNIQVEEDAGTNYTRKMNPSDWVFCPPEPRALDDYTSNSDIEEEEPFLAEQEEEEDRKRKQKIKEGKPNPQGGKGD